MANTKNVQFLVAALLAGGAAGCGPSWTVVKQATPNTLAGKKSFSVDPVSWEGLSIGGKDTEDAWIGKRKPDEQEKFKAEWEKDKAETGQVFATRVGNGLGKFGGAVASAPGGDAFGMKALVEMYEPGFWSPMGFGNAPTVVTMKVDFTDGTGAVQDTVKFTGSIMGSIFAPVPTQRMRMAVENIGDQVAEYLKGRTAVK